MSNGVPGVVPATKRHAQCRIVDQWVPVDDRGFPDGSGTAVNGKADLGVAEDGSPGATGSIRRRGAESVNLFGKEGKQDPGGESNHGCLRRETAIHCARASDPVVPQI
jgi:hypothetical protein